MQPKLTTQPAVASGATGAVPTVVTDGAPVGNAFRVIISADSTKTLSGAGAVRIWGWSTNLGRWCRNPELDFDVTVSGVQDQIGSDYVTQVKDGRVFAQVVGVTASSGNITPQIETY